MKSVAKDVKKPKSQKKSKSESACEKVPKKPRPQK